MRRALLRPGLIQGAVYVASGLWPIAHPRSFERVTGPKRDEWLAKTVGALIAIIGGTLVVADATDRLTPELRALGAGSAATLGFISSFYAARGRISKVYFADSALEATLAGLWALPAMRS